MKQTRMPVAIIGIGCRFPAGIVDAESFWRVIASGTDAITEIPANREGLADWYDPRPQTKGRMVSKYGGFLGNIEEFDAAFFGISPREAERVDPQQRLLLETSWEALEDAGVNIAALDPARTGVYVGQWTSDFETKIFNDTSHLDLLGTSGSGRYAASGRISYALGLRGPSLTIDTACSSSLAAIHLACQALHTGECTVALAGGVNVILEPHISIAYSQSRMMAPDGRCKFGDASGDGYVRSEGAGMLVLKPLSEAQADGDRIYAVIRGSAVNNDGRSSGVMGRPSQIGHEEMLRTAYASAGIAPNRAGYIEAHGTGTRAGDPVEIAALANVIGAGRTRDDLCLIGSVKTNFGHTEGAAGVAGVIKAALALAHREIPPSLHFRDPNPAVAWSDIPLVIPRERTAWQGAPPRVAGVNSFGIAGTNAHVVLEEAPAADAPARSRPSRDAEVLALSARSEPALRALASRYADVLASADVSLGDVCWSAATRRTALSVRAAFVAADSARMRDQLRQFAAGDRATSEGTALDRPRVALVFPGQGAQWIGMGRELMAREPVFRDTLAQCDAAVRRVADWSIIEQIALDETDARYALNRIAVIQPVLVAMGIAYAELWKSFGVVPEGVVGHSMGEIGAAYAAGALTLDDAMRIACVRAALLQRVSGHGAMALVELGEAELHERLRAVPGVSIAVNNSARSNVISGAPEAVRTFVKRVEAEGVFAKLVNVDVASHSAQTDPLASELATSLAALEPAPHRVPFYSTVTAARTGGTALTSAYWASNLRNTVRFGETVRAMIDDGFAVFIEMGPHPILLPSIEQNAGHAEGPVRVIASGRRDTPDVVSMRAAIGDAFCAGCAIDWAQVMPGKGRAIPLPLYPWQRERHWLRTPPRAADGRGDVAPDARTRDWVNTLVWQPIPSTVAHRAAGANTLVAAMDEPRAAALVQDLPGNVHVVPASQISPAAIADADRVIFVAANEALVAHELLPLVRAMAAVPNVRAKLSVVTCGAQLVNGDRAQIAAHEASAWGTARVIAEEYPQLWGRAVDLDPAAATPENAAALAAELNRADNEDQVAVRRGQRYGLRLAPVAIDEQPVGAPWRADAAYLITGGLGALGLRIAQKMVADGARRLVIVTRTPLPPRAEWNSLDAGGVDARRVAGVHALERAGASVHLLTADVGDGEALERAIRSYEAEAWPQIRGVIHAAGIIDNRLMGDIDRAAFERVVKPKLHGALQLDRLFPDAEVFVMFSSVASWLGPAGMANYAAANAGLDAVAASRRARGAHAVSIQWGAWEQTGMQSGETGRQILNDLRAQGIDGFSPEDGVSAFPWLAQRPETSVTFSPIDWRALGEARRWRERPLVRDRIDAHRDAHGTNDASALARASLAERMTTIESIVRAAAGQVLRMPAQQIDRSRPFGAMGLTSTMALELRNRLEKSLDRTLSATLTWNYPTVNALVAFLAGDDVAEAATAAPDPVPIGDVAEMSDEDAARALRRG